MNKLILQILEQLRKLWSALESGQKITIVLLAVLILFALFFIGTWGARPDFETLFSNLDNQDAGAIVTKLNEAKIPYKLTNGGSTVLVPQKYVYEMRIQMASQGLPKGSGVGFEVFDNFKLGATEFTQKLNFQRALQTELERTIVKIGKVRQARVHIAIPDEAIFADEKQETTASVVLDLLGTSALSQKQVQGIAHLVASAVKGLKPKDITIIDTDGNLLFSPEESAFGDGGDFSSTQMEAKHNFEKSVEKGIQSMLITVIGTNKSVVRVNADLDFNQEKVESEEYVPSEEPIMRSEKMTEESYAGEGDQNGKPGVAGTAANIPGIGAGGGTGSSKYSKLDEVRNYEITKRIKHEIKAPGAVKRLSVAVILDRQINEEQTKSITEIIKVAAGINETRGDSLVIKNIDFDKSALKNDKDELEKQAKMEQMMAIAKAAGTALFVLIFIMFLFLTLRKVPSTVGVAGRSKEIMKETSSQVDEELAKRERELQVELEKIDKLAQPSTETQKKNVMQKNIEDIITGDVDGFIKLLRSWLIED